MAGTVYFGAGKNMAFWLCMFTQLLIVATKSVAQVTPPFIVFGDSTVDTGSNNYINTTKDFLANFPPFGQTYFGKPTGRFSNGRLFVDFLCKWHYNKLLHKHRWTFCVVSCCRACILCTTLLTIPGKAALAKYVCERELPKRFQPSKVSSRGVLSTPCNNREREDMWSLEISLTQASHTGEYAGRPFLSPYLEPGADHSKGVNFASGGSGVLDETNAGLVIFCNFCVHTTFFRLQNSSLPV